MDGTSAAVPTRVVVADERARGRWSRRIAWVVTGLSVLVALSSLAANARYFQRDARLAESWHALSRTAPAKVAVVDVAGAILGGEGFAMRQIEQVRRDDAVKAIVLRVDSPGGTVSGADEIHERLRRVVADRDIPVVVSMGSIAASGGYYVAMANAGRDDVIFAEPATLTGSIGVIIPHFDVSRLLERFDVADDSITSGPLKEMLSPTKARTPELADRERAVLQALVDDMFARFKDIVRAGRPKLDEAALDRVATGQVFTAQQALAAGLVDRIGFLDDAIDRAVELAGLTAQTARVVRYARPRSLVEELLGAGVPTARGPLEAFADLTTPRVWALASWWPALVASHR
ncbi:MAG: signal peptide peptidase SppA [Planctomycetaceae bacterium]